MVNSDNSSIIDSADSDRFQRGPVYRARRILVVGCSVIGATVAVRLSDSGNIIKVLDRDPNAFRLLPQRRIETTRIVPVVGDGRSESDLRRASAHESDILIATTDSATVNLMAAQIGLHLIRVPRVICLIDEEDVGEIFAELGIQILARDSLTVDFLLGEAMK
mgnify:CR=1 FL=1